MVKQGDIHDEINLKPGAIYLYILSHCKILLHEQRATPKMTVLGFAVAPGTHTLVAIETTQVNLQVYI